MPSKASVGRFDGEIKVVAFNEGDPVEALLTKAGLTLGDGEQINDEEGNEVSPSSPATADETYYIVGNYKQGAQ